MTAWEAVAIARQNAFNEWVASANVIPDVNGQLHAGPGGAIGANGEHYEHGQFIATSPDTIKGEMIVERARMIAKESWEADPACVELGKQLLAYQGTNNFLFSLADQLEERGTLSEKQVAAGIAALEREAEKAKDNAEVAAVSKHVGTVGERRDFVLTVEKSLAFDSDYGTFFINLSKDANGNVVIYKGSNSWGWWEGHEIHVKATIKSHDDYQGIAQTIISRPKVEEDR